MPLWALVLIAAVWLGAAVAVGAAYAAYRIEEILYKAVVEAVEKDVDSRKADFVLDNLAARVRNLEKSRDGVMVPGDN